MSYRIKSVAAITGIAATTLRAWERRYDLVSPRRTESGYRVYSEEDVATLSQVKALVDRGYKVGEAVEMVRRDIPDLPPGNIDADELADLRSELLERLLALDRTGAAQVYDRLAAVPFDRQTEEVIFPLLQQVGDLWAAGDVSVAQEHFCSAFLRSRLAVMLETLAAGSRPGREAVCAGAPGEQHEFGLLASAIHLAMRGWRVTYLGADVPLDELQPLLSSRRPELLCSSVITPLSREQCLVFARALSEASPEETTVVVGGAGLAPKLPRRPFDNTFFARTMDELFRLPGVNGKGREQGTGNR